MIKEKFIISKPEGWYYSYPDWTPKFSGNIKQAHQFDTYEEAQKLLEEGSRKWFSGEIYQIEKIFVLENE